MVKAPDTVRLAQRDNVVVACRDLPAGHLLEVERVACLDAIPAGHKVATSAIPEGSVVRKYDQIIGLAATQIAPGQHVHTHNLLMTDPELEHHFGSDLRIPEEVPNPATFQGFERAGGRIGTRNYIGILSSVNCSATVVREIANIFKYRPELLAEYGNVDGVVGLVHGGGCGIGGDGEGIQVLRRTLGGYSQHPNFAGVLMIGLGCEANQIRSLLRSQNLVENDLLRTFTIQETGGTSKAIEQGVSLIKEMLPAANRRQRKTVPASHLILGLQCGGSDGYSGITANPALGAAADILVRNGGTAILSETPEIYGAEHLLTSRAISSEVGAKLLARIHWWKDYVARSGGRMDNNPSAGNKAGGLTTILEKSLGAVMKAGTSNLSDVYEYAELVKSRGLVFMDTPGYDPVSVTGQVAGGANLICFTTGRGSAFGCQPVPCLKLSSNTETYTRQTEDMDINCGTILDGAQSIKELGQQIFDQMLAVASGEKTKSEQFGYGQNEFVPWSIGATM